MTPSRPLLTVMTAFALLLALSARAQPAEKSAAFDGRWNVVMTCPPHNAADDDAKGYTHRYAGVVSAGELRAVHGAEGEPGASAPSASSAE